MSISKSKQTMCNLIAQGEANRQMEVDTMLQSNENDDVYNSSIIEDTMLNNDTEMTAAESIDSSSRTRSLRSSRSTNVRTRASSSRSSSSRPSSNTVTLSSRSTSSHELASSTSTSKSTPAATIPTTTRPATTPAISSSLTTTTTPANASTSNTSAFSPSLEERNIRQRTELVPFDLSHLRNRAMNKTKEVSIVTLLQPKIKVPLRNNISCMLI